MGALYGTRPSAWLGLNPEHPLAFAVDFAAYQEHLIDQPRTDDKGKTYYTLRERVESGLGDLEDLDDDLLRWAKGATGAHTVKVHGKGGDGIE